MIPQCSMLGGKVGREIRGYRESPDIREPGPGYGQQMTHRWMTGDGG